MDEQQQQQRYFPLIHEQSLQSEIISLEQCVQNTCQLAEDLKNQIRNLGLIHCEDTIRKLKSDLLHQVIEGAVRNLAVIHID